MKTNSFYISREDTIKDVQDRFSQFFPLLTIHFYSQNDKVSNTSCPMFSPDCRIGDLSPFNNEKSVHIKEDMASEEMENIIQENFGLHAEITYKMKHSYNKLIMI